MEVSIYTVVDILNAMSLHMANARFEFSVVEDTKICVVGDKGKNTLSSGDVSEWLRLGADYLMKEELAI